MRLSLVRGFMGGAALMIGVSCCLCALTGDLVIWASPIMVSARVWNGVLGLAWLLFALHSLRPLPSRFGRWIAVLLGLFAVASAQDTFVYYSLVAEGGIDTSSMALRDRVAQGVELYHQCHVEFLLMTGGVDPNHGQNEAQIMGRLAVQAGVPLDRVRFDEMGVNTRASAVNCTQIMNDQNWGSALLVSHDYHLLRAKSAFSRAGALVYTVPAEETRPMLRAPYFVLRECLAWIYYALPSFA